MGLKYLWDTNTVIYFLQQQFPPEAEQRIDSMLQLSAPCISAITEIELLSWKSALVLLRVPTNQPAIPLACRLVKTRGPGLSEL